MALNHGEQIKESSTTTGTGTITLGGAAAGHRTFGSKIPDGSDCYFKILDANGSAWEVSKGVFDAAAQTLTRAEVVDSSDGAGTAITLTAGTHTVLMSAVAGRSTGDLDHGDSIFEKANLKNYFEPHNTPAIAAGVLTLDLDTGNFFDVTMDANITSLVISRAGGVKPVTGITLWLTQDATGSRTFTPGAAFKKLGSTAIDVASGANEQTCYSLITRDSGTTWTLFQSASGAVTNF